MLVDTRSRPDDLVTGDDDATLEQHRRTVALRVESVPIGVLPLACRRAPVGKTAVHQAKLEGCGSAENFLGAHGRILYTRQLHDDAIVALALNHRFGHTEFVDAIFQRRNILFERGALFFRQRRIVVADPDKPAAIIVAVSEFEIANSSSSNSFAASRSCALANRNADLLLHRLTTPL